MSKTNESVKNVEAKLQSEIDKLSSKLLDIEELMMETNRNLDCTHLLKELESKIFNSMEKQAKDIAADVTALERKIEFYNYNKTNQKQNNLGLTSEELKVILSKNDMKIKHIEDLTESILTKFTYERVENQDNSNIKTTNYKSCMVDRADLKILETKFVNQIEQLQEEMLQFINTATANEKELDARLRILENSETCNPAIYVSNTQKEMKSSKQKKDNCVQGCRKSSVQTSFPQSQRKTRNDSSRKEKTVNIYKIEKNEGKLENNKTSAINLKYSHDDYEMSESKYTEDDEEILKDNLTSGAMNLLNELDAYKDGKGNTDLYSENNTDLLKLNDSEILEVDDRNNDLAFNMQIEKAYDPYKINQNSQKQKKSYDMRGNSCKNSMISSSAFGKKASMKNQKVGIKNREARNMSNSSRNSGSRQRKSSRKVMKRNPVSVPQMKKSDRSKSKNTKGKENTNRLNTDNYPTKQRYDINIATGIKQNSTLIKTDKNSKKLKKLERMYQELSLVDMSNING